MELPVKRPSNSESEEPYSPIESLQKPKQKNSQISISALEEYAGEGVAKNRYNEIVKYKQTGKYPESIESIKVNQIKLHRVGTFLTSADNYEISQQLISPLSQSKLCYKLQNHRLSVIPFKSEVEDILKALHIENGQHLNKTTTKERVKIFKVFWPGHLKEIQNYINNCICKYKSKNMLFQRIT